jgi:hypothetical protein
MFQLPAFRPGSGERWLEFKVGTFQLLSASHRKYFGDAIGSRLL